jgi:hypothetical protein
MNSLFDETCGFDALAVEVLTFLKSFINANVVRKILKLYLSAAAMATRKAQSSMPAPTFVDLYMTDFITILFSKSLAWANKHPII